MLKKLELENFKINESEQYSFYRIPKLLFSDEFKDLSTDAKVLYGLFLDRMSLSRINDWCDNDGNVYIIFTREEMNEILKTTSPTISKIQKELEEKGLIERKRQGLGNPSLIYLKNFNVKRLKNFTSRSKENLLQEVKKFNTNNTDINNTLEAKKIKAKKIAENNDDVLFDSSYEERHNLREELTSKGLDITVFEQLHKFVKKLYYEQIFSAAQCLVLSDMLKTMDTENNKTDVAKAYSYSLSRLKKNRSRIKDKFSYLLSILPKNLEIVKSNQNTEDFSFDDIRKNLHP